MNNRFKFYRVEHISHKYTPQSTEEPVCWGPYLWVQALQQENRLDEEPEYLKLYNLLGRNEPSNTNPKKRRLAKIGLFSTFVDNRPGPREDPYLRGKLQWTKESAFANKYVFGFDSIQQLNGWFHDAEERYQLDRCDFVIGTYYVKKMISGLRQAVVHKHDVMYRVNTERLVTNTIQGITYEDSNGITSR